MTCRRRRSISVLTVSSLPICEILCGGRGDRHIAYEIVTMGDKGCPRPRTIEVR